jgi:epimerase transport system membrane fusion protein
MTLELTSGRDAGRAVAASAAFVSESATGAIRAGLVIIVLFFGLFGGWAVMAPLNGAVVAEAVVKVEGNRKAIQHLDGGVITEIRVKEGDLVKAGDVLVVLDNTRVKADLDTYTQQYAVLRTMLARIQAELSGEPEIAFPEDLLASTAPYVLDAIASQRSEFASQQAALAGATRVLNSRIAEIGAQIVGSQARIVSYSSQLQSTLEEKTGLATLLENKLTTKTRVLDLERSAAQLQGLAGDAQASIAANEQGRAELEAQITQLTNERRAKITTDFSDTQSKLLDLTPRIQAAQAPVRATEIRSPYDGRVVGLSVFSTGAVIVPGQSIMDIVPDRTQMVVQAQIRVEDIADLRPGMKAEVHFTSYKQRSIPLIHGLVAQVSADRLTDSRSGVPYYIAEIAVNPVELAASPQIVLYPGMPATVMIPTEQRTALDYLVGPLVASMDTAFRQK